MLDIKAHISGIRFAKTHEAEFDEKTLMALTPLAPFVLLRYGGLKPEPDQRMADEGSGIKKPRFFLSIGSTSLRDKSDAQRGCYSILDELRARYDGGALATDLGDVNLALEEEIFIFSAGGLIVYGAEYSYYEV